MGSKLLKVLPRKTATIHLVKLETLGTDGLFQAMQANSLFFLRKKDLHQLLFAKQSGKLETLSFLLGMYDWYAQLPRFLHNIQPQCSYEIWHNWKSMRVYYRSDITVEYPYYKIVNFMFDKRCFPATCQDARLLEQANFYQYVKVNLASFCSINFDRR